MVKKIFFILLSLITCTVNALEIEFIGPCSKAPLFSKIITKNYLNIGEMSVDILTTNQIPFEGTEQGLNSVFSTPVGLDALEVISDTEMRAYGWCFNVDGIYPNVFANEVKISSNTQKVQWVFSFAHYLNGDWISQCKPAYNVKPSFLCPN